MPQRQYLSESALEDVKKELQERKTIKRKELAEQIGAAKELGDLSENFEYYDAKERQGQNESRILQLENMIHNAVIVSKRTGESTINLGTRFQTKIGDIEKTFEIVGATESNPMEGKISNESPLGNAFLGLSVGEVATVQTPDGNMEYKIISIE